MLWSSAAFIRGHIALSASRLAFVLPTSREVTVQFRFTDLLPGVGPLPQTTGCTYSHRGSPNQESQNVQTSGVCAAFPPRLNATLQCDRHLSAAAVRLSCCPRIPHSATPRAGMRGGCNSPMYSNNHPASVLEQALDEHAEGIASRFRCSIWNALVNRRRGTLFLLRSSGDDV